MVKGLPSIDQIDVYEGCVYGKQTRRAFPTNRAWRASKPLELIYADICGPMETRSLGGNRYFLLFTYDHTLMSWVYFLDYKSQALEHFWKFKALVEKQSGLPIKYLRTDREGEFLSNKFKAFYEDHGIHRESMAPYTPQQNGVVERKNRTVVEMARSLLKGKIFQINYGARQLRPLCIYWTFHRHELY